MQKRALILILEDSSDDAALVERELHKGGLLFTLERVDSRAAFESALQESMPDLILLTPRQGSFDGTQALAMARGELPDVPVVILCGAAGEEPALEALRNGAADYILKDRLDRLAPAVRQALELGDRRRAERAAQATERRFRALTQTLPAVVFVHQDGRFRYLNSAAESILGYPPEELLHRNFWEVIHPDFRELVRQRGLSRQLGDRVPARYEFPIVTRRGETRWLDCTATRIEFDGQSAVMGSAFDVTERIRAEGALRQSEQRLRVLVDALPDFIFRLDRDGAILDFKAPNRANLPRGTGESLCTALLERAGGLAAETPRAFLERILTSGAGQSLSFPFRLGDETRHFEASATLCGAGEVLVVVRDVSEQRRLEEEILEISSRERRRIGHDLHDGLGQYLAAVALKAGVLEDALTTSSSPHRVAARRLVRLLNQAVTRTRSLAHGLDPIDLDAVGLVSALKTLAQETGDLFGVPCDFRAVGGRLPLTRFVALQLYRIAQEGVHNAVEHGRPGRVQIELARVRGAIRLRIRDDGRGFDAEGPRAGGMGLRIMRHRAHVVGGALQIRSRPRKGALIECLVALAPAGTARTAGPAGPRAAPPPANPPLTDRPAATQPSRRP